MDSIAGPSDTAHLNVEDNPWFRLGDATARLKWIKLLAGQANDENLDLDDPADHARHWDYIAQIRALAEDA